jgi:hypothetical protein
MKYLLLVALVCIAGKSIFDRSPLLNYTPPLDQSVREINSFLLQPTQGSLTKVPPTLVLFSFK